MQKIRGVFEKIPGSGVWWIRYVDASGRLRREKIGAKSNAKKLVEARRTAAQAGVKMPDNLRTKAATFSKLAERALAYSKANKRSYTHDVQRMAHLVEEFGNRRAEDIKPDEIKAWLDSKADQWSQSTRNRHIALMKLTYRLAEQGGAIKTNPVRQVKQTAEDNERNRPLSPAEEDRLRSVILKSYSDFLPEFEIALMTGMRQSEQFQRDWHSVDLDTGTIRLAQTKNGKSRIVRLNSRALAAMRMLHSKSLGTGRVFLHEKPRWFTKAVREAKIEDFTWHDLRHTWATRLVAAGVDLKTVQDLGGWKNIGMVARYAHADKTRFGLALEKLCAATDTRTDTKQSEAETMVSPAILQ